MEKNTKKVREHRPCYIASQCTRISQSNCLLYVTYMKINFNIFIEHDR